MMLKILSILWIAVFSLCPLAQADEDYKFRDEDGDEIIYPSYFPIYSVSEPGPWSAEESRLHEPILKWRWRKEGLESIRILRIEVPHPSQDKSLGTIRTVSVFDKDLLPVGFAKISPEEKKIEAEFRINSVINYVEVLVSCSVHGLWKKEFKLEASNSEDRSKLNSPGPEFL